MIIKVNITKKNYLALTVFISKTFSREIFRAHGKYEAFLVLRSNNIDKWMFHSSYLAQVNGAFL